MSATRECKSNNNPTIQHIIKTFKESSDVETVSKLIGKPITKAQVAALSGSLNHLRNIDSKGTLEHKTELCNSSNYAKLISNLDRIELIESSLLSLICVRRTFDENGRSPLWDQSVVDIVIQRSTVKH